MSKILVVLAILFVLIFVILVLAAIIAFHLYFCNEVCPHSKHCQAHENDDDFVPPCHKNKYTHEFQNF